MDLWKTYVPNIGLPTNLTPIPSCSGIRQKYFDVCCVLLCSVIVIHGLLQVVHHSGNRLQMQGGIGIDGILLL